MKWTAEAIAGIERLSREGRVIEHGRKPIPIAEEISEKDFMAAVIGLAKRHGWRCYHAYDSRKSTAGFPDLVMVRAGRLVVAELKVGDNKPTGDQQSWLDDLAEVNGIMVRVWYPRHWAEIEEAMR